MSLLAEVARNYFELRGTQNRLAVARRNADNQRQTLDLTNALLEGGRGTELDTSRAEAQLTSTLASIPPLETVIKRAMYRLGVLIGQQPTALELELSKPLPLPTLPTLVALGRPDDLLRRRPDIRVTERNLAAGHGQRRGGDRRPVPAGHPRRQCGAAGRFLLGRRQRWQ